MSAQQPGFAIVHNADRNVVALFERRVLLFVRRGPLTEAALHALGDVALLLASVTSEELKCGFLGVVPAEAGVSDPALYHLQLALFRSVGAAQHVYAAMCVLGEQSQSSAMTVVARSLAGLMPNARVFEETAAASRWLSEQLSLDPRNLQRSVLEISFLVQ